MAERIRLAPQHRKMLEMALVELFVGRLDGHILRHGGDHPIEDLHWEKEGELLMARQGRFVMGLNFSLGNLPVPQCTCASGPCCKHTAALVLYLMERKHDVAAHEKQKMSVAGPVFRLVRELSGKDLSRRAENLLRAADAWHQSKTARINGGELSRLCGRAVFQGYNDQDVALYPLGFPPKDAMDFMACLVLVARRMGLTLPEPIAEVVDETAVSRMRGKWEEDEAVGKWLRSFDQWSAEEAPLRLPEVRLRLHESGALLESRADAGEPFAKATRKQIEGLFHSMRRAGAEMLPLGTALSLRAVTDSHGHFGDMAIKANGRALVESLSRLFAVPEIFSSHVAGEDGKPPTIAKEPLRWRLAEPGDEPFYRLDLVDAQGQSVPPPVAVLPGSPRHYVTTRAVYPVMHWPRGLDFDALPMRIPVRALESSKGISALHLLDLPVPEKISSRVRVLKPSVTVTAEIVTPRHSKSEYLRLAARGVYPFEGAEDVLWTGESWSRMSSGEAREEETGSLMQMDNTVLDKAGAWLRELPLKPVVDYRRDIRLEQRIRSKDWGDEFAMWLERRPEGCEIQLSGELASLAEGRVAGTVRLDIEESGHGIDWFDLHVSMEVSDTTLTQHEINLLLKAQGRWVRLEGRGWRKLELSISEEQRAELAALGLAAHDFGAEKQRLHALQLGALAKDGGTLIGAERIAQVRRRIGEIQTRVTPSVPPAIIAQMRPYQIEGFHFLSYLTENNFGGVLADDMGLGKTLQALAWVAWLRAEKQLRDPVLVVCPKSVQDNWRAESGKFFPELKVGVWTRDTAGKPVHDDAVDLLVIHYAQLRHHAERLASRQWGAVILDEAQAIKNPSSQTARAACSLVAARRLALTGTPIENRLMDLWSVFAFAMPGVLGSRASFSKHFDGKGDSFARKRLAARTRPFLLRRTKKEVERELPERIEEDLIIEFDGTQADLYQAELKHARATLLKVATDRQLDKVRFNILTSLLRLRQICCHPKLIGFSEKAASESSAKVSALLETIEPLMEEGQKVLVFSQFVGMLEIIGREIAARGWPAFQLTGATEDRGPLVEAFQNHNGEAVFLISLKAGGSGLNLTAASYVVLFDPWWNPAVEAQAIDRTHRIGQKKTVFAYRLLIKGTIEEKIRLLQKQKGALARDILGEESFAQALTLDDFRFLLGEDEEG